MSLASRAKQHIWYAVFDRAHDIYDEDGNLTGEKMAVYYDIVLTRGVLSDSGGKSHPSPNGVVTPYQYILLLDDMFSGITEQTRVWCGIKAYPYEQKTYNVGDCVYQQQKLWRCVTAITQREQWNIDHWKLIPHTHEVISVYRGLKVMSYKLRKVDNDEP